METDAGGGAEGFMRWKDNPRPRVRTCEGFLLMPRKINGESRWLEWAKWIETLVQVKVPLKGGVFGSRWKWVALKWVADPECERCGDRCFVLLWPTGEMPCPECRKEE